MQFSQGWLEVAGCPVEAYAEPEMIQVNWEEGSIYMGFKASTTELNALVLGQNYQVESNYQDVTLLGGLGKNGEFNLKDITGKSGYTLPGKEDIYAYYLKDEQSGKGEHIDVVDKITASHQIQFVEGSKVKISSNLVGKQIRARVPIVFPKIVIILNHPWCKPILARIMTTDKKLFTFESQLLIEKNQTALKGALRTIPLQFKPGSQTCLDLSA
jgi:hypothetical protein